METKDFVLGFAAGKAQGGGSGDPVLPSQYQEVEYLSCTGEQYITVPYTIKVGDIITIDTALDANAGTSEEAAAGAYTNASQSWELYYENNTLILYRSYASNFRIIYQPESIQRDTRYSFIFESLINLSNSFYFGCYRIGYYPFTGRLYLVEIMSYDLTKKAFEKVLKLVPCYRKADNVIGFYDVCSNTFYTNDGTGDFGKGPDVN